MQISLSEIMNLKGESRTVETEITKGFFTNYGVNHKYLSKQPVKLTLTCIGDMTVKVAAVIICSLSARCDRCLEPVEIPLDLEVLHELKISEDGEAYEEDDKVGYVCGYDLDVDALVNEEIMIGFPMKVLCKDDCKGICRSCGANLNKGECGCDRTEPDPRMSVIRDLFKGLDLPEGQDD